MLRATVALLALLPLAATASAQLKGLGEVVGVTANSLGATVLKTDMDTCKNAVCKAGITSSASTKLLHGGTAWDSRLGGIWISTGKNLACVDPYTCRVICKEQKAPFAKLTNDSPLPPIVGGLAMDQHNRVLYMADSANQGIHQVTIGADCTFKARFCYVSRNLPAGHIIGGLAIDNVRNLLFVGSYRPATGAVAVYVTPIGTASRPTWCLRKCNLTGSGSLSFPQQCVPPKAVKAHRITGLAFDSCRSILFVTNGPVTTGYQFSKSGTTAWGCTVKPIKCCRYVSRIPSDMHIGLAILPGRVTSVGKSCQHKNCAQCPKMILEPVGHPTVGNDHFAVKLSNAPSLSAPVFIGVGLGRCFNPGIHVGWCGNLRTSARWVIAVPMAPGPRPCGGTTRVPMPVPDDYSGCGVPISVQFVMGCRSLGGGGEAVSNCLQFVITGG